MTLILALLGLLLAPPPQAATLAAGLTGADSGALQAICRRESRCRTVGLHEGDAWLGARAYDRARARGWLPSWCPFEGGSRWATRGAWGQVAAYQMRGWCLPPEVLDIPLVGAFFAARQLLRVERGRALPAGRRWAYG
jgi:hypothetical protein